MPQTRQLAASGGVWTSKDALIAIFREKRPDVRLSRGTEDLLHMRKTPVRFSNTLQAIPYFASFGNEIVVRIDDE
jgi:hypothetical protein